jgi:hypothetical protein
MVVIFGWGGGDTKDLGEVAPTTCPRCHNQVFLHHVTSSRQFSLYFIPVANYGGDAYLLCPVCRNGLQVQPAHRSAVQTMVTETRMFRRGTMPLAAYQARVAQFWARLGVDPSGGQPLQPTAAIPPPAVAGPEVRGPAAGGAPLADQLAQLAELHEQGILTDEEFGAAKRRLIEG